MYIIGVQETFWATGNDTWNMIPTTDWLHHSCWPSTAHWPGLFRWLAGSFGLLFQDDLHCHLVTSPADNHKNMTVTHPISII